MTRQRHSRNSSTVFVLAMVVLVIGAVPAAAKRGGGNGGPPGGGEPEPIVGQTCEEYYGAATPVTPVDDHTFVLTMTSPGYPCVDVEAPAGTWVVAVDVGSAREVSVQLRSSVPGDWCWSEHVRSDTTLYLDAPASTPNACLIPGAGEESIEDAADPLAFTVYVAGKRLKTPVVVTVTLPST